MYIYNEEILCFCIFFSTLEINKKKIESTIVDIVALKLICIFWTSIYGLVTAIPPTEDSTEGQTTVVISPTQKKIRFLIF